jgi:hypothetical protein
MVVLGCLLALPMHAQAAVALHEFAEAGGCRVRGSPESIARLKEIAAEGSVTWVGKCTGRYIDGAGVLRHQGVTKTNERARRYVFYFSGSAKAGVRIGIWSRETFNMFEDSSRYWTSLATITYVDGIAKGSPKLREVRGNADFSAPFRAFLAETDKRLANGQEKPAPAPEASAPARTAQAPAQQASPFVPAAPQAEPPAAVMPAPPAVALAPPAPPPRGEPPAAASAAATIAPARPAAPPSSSSRQPAGSAFQGSGLRPLDSPGTRLAAAPQQQEVLEQNTACSVDEINGTVVRPEPIVVSVGQLLRISGWAADPRQPRIPEQAWIRVFDRGGGPGLLLDLPRNTNRPDVAGFLGNALYARAGFVVTIEPGRLAPGEYTVAIVQQLGGIMAVCTATGRLSLMAGDARAAPSPR